MMVKKVAQELRLILPINRAFSLLEVSLAIFLLALVVSFSLPIFTVANNNDLKNLSAKFITLVSDTRNQASLEREPYFLYLDVNKGAIFSYQTEQELTDFLEEDLSEEEAFQENRILLNNLKGIKISQIHYQKKKLSSLSIRFDPSGFSELFSITFSSNSRFIRYEQTSVLGSFYVSTN